MKQKISIVMILSITFVILFSYQNCGVEAPQSMFDSVQKYKVPYETKIDQVAYMSCSEQLNIPNKPGVFFTFRMGAYGEGAGLRLSDNFLYETRRDDSEDRAFKLGEEYVSMNHRVQFSIRAQNNLLGTLFRNGNSTEGIEEKDFDFVFGDLGSNEMSASLVPLTTDEYLNYWAAGGISSDAYMQGTMVFNDSETIAAQLRSFLEDDWILTVGYAQPAEPGVLLTRADYASSNKDDDGDGREDDADDDVVEPNEAYGLGLKVSFKQPLPSNWGYTLNRAATRPLNVPNVSLPNRVLASVYEYDLADPKNIKAQWQCPSELQLRIVYPADKDLDDPYFDNDPNTQSATVVNLCPDAADPTNPVDLANFQIVRRSLPTSDWKINWARKCVVPKSYVNGSCYGIDRGVTPNVTRTPVYDFTERCDPAINPACLHFVSICIRQ